QTRGIDAEANYRFDIGGMGSLALSLVGTYTDEYIVEPKDGDPTYDCSGLFGTVCGTPIPEWRHKMRANWMSPWGFDVALTWRHIASVDLDSTSSNPSLSGAVPFTDKQLGARDYFDLSGSYTFSDLGPFANLTGRLGINNVLDK